MKLLIIEDDTTLLKILRKGLSTIYHVDTAATGEAGIHEVMTNTYDLIVLDLGLPDMTGLDVCRQLRAAGNATTILILTAEDNTDRKVELLDGGADDYLTKPFNIDELHARVRALLRRHSPVGQGATLTLGDMTLNTATREVRRSGKSITLRRKEFEILEYMMHHTGLILTRAMIFDHAWDRNDELWANAVDVHIKNLRDKIDRPFEEKFIKTVYGLGYKLEEPKLVAPHPTYRKEVIR